MKLAYTPLFAYEIALGFDPPEKVCQTHKVSPEEWAQLQSFEPFNKAVESFVKDIATNGVQTELKARLFVDNMLPTVMSIAEDSSVEPETRLKALEFVKSLAKTDNKSVGSNGFNLQIIIPAAGEPAKIIPVSQQKLTLAK